ncbi:protein pelota homolog [Corticium candelabrum]|uniref:protein pelota homolog n=1 Tax=Corticium candelabrum TaxID=121492 RepID=UPI002E25FA97|nr:protein pelota homolog [Corticium candelabrum]
MKLLHRDISEKNGSGVVNLIAEEAEDMWHAYNLVAVGDSVRSTTIRKVQSESATGSSTSSRVRTTLTLSVESTDLDTAACVLRVKGRNIQENQYVRMGAYHTLDLELNRKFSLRKECWDVVALDRLDVACDPARTADVAVVIMQEGLAHVCLVTSSMTVVKTKIEMNIPRKRRGHCEQHDKALLRFYDAIMQGILRHIRFDVVKCVLVASPGFVKEQCCDYMFAQAIKTDNRTFIENKAKFLQVHSSSGHKHSIKEVLSDPAVAVKLADTKAAAEVRALDAFYAMLQNEPNRAFYGMKHVEAANEQNAIEILLITDDLFRSSEIETRRRYVSLVESVKDSSGEVRIFSSLHVSGEQLCQLSGVAAILRFPLPDIGDDDESDED